MPTTRSRKRNGEMPAAVVRRGAADGRAGGLAEGPQENPLPAAPGPDTVPAVAGHGETRGQTENVQVDPVTSNTGLRQQTGGNGRGDGRGVRRAGRRGRVRQEDDEDEANSFFDDPGHEERLQAREGVLGIIGPRGWETKTNFLI